MGVIPHDDSSEDNLSRLIKSTYNWDPIPGRHRKFFLPSYSELLWSHPSSHPMYIKDFPWGKVTWDMKLTTHFHFMFPIHYILWCLGKGNIPS
jgi:hypothetical protein